MIWGNGQNFSKSTIMYIQITLSSLVGRKVNVTDRNIFCIIVHKMWWKWGQQFMEICSEWVNLNTLMQFSQGSFYSYPESCLVKTCQLNRVRILSHTISKATTTKYLNWFAKSFQQTSSWPCSSQVQTYLAHIIRDLSWSEYINRNGRFSSPNQVSVVE